MISLFFFDPVDGTLPTRNLGSGPWTASHSSHALWRAEAHWHLAARGPEIPRRVFRAHR